MNGKKNKENGIKKKGQAKWNEENRMRKTELMNGDRNIECGTATTTTESTTTESTTKTTTAVIRK